MGFQAAGFCVLKGPDLLWGQNIKDFDASLLREHIQGIIAGVPCQRFSIAVNRNKRNEHPDLWPEFWRIVSEIRPAWILAENVPGAQRAAVNLFNPITDYLPSYRIVDFSKLGSAQRRKRLILFSSLGDFDNAFWQAIEKHGFKWGTQWRGKVKRKPMNKPIFRTVIGDGTMANNKSSFFSTVYGDSFEARNISAGKPGRYLKFEELLDAFDLPYEWNLDPNELAYFSRRSKGKMVCQGVPVAAAYSLARAVRLAIHGH